MASSVKYGNEARHNTRYFFIFTFHELSLCALAYKMCSQKGLQRHSGIINNFSLKKWQKSANVFVTQNKYNGQKKQIAKQNATFLKMINVTCSSGYKS